MSHGIASAPRCAQPTTTFVYYCIFLQRKVFMNIPNISVVLMVAAWQITSCAHPSAEAHSAPVGDDYRVSQSEDDAEESADGEVDLMNDDLDLGQRSGFESAATIGIRFENIRISRREKIRKAAVLFTMEGNRVKSEPSDLTIRGQLSPNAEAFEEEHRNISRRPVTKASVRWSPEPWDPEQAQEERPRSPDLSVVIQEVVDQEGWMPGNALVLIIEGTGERDALSFDGGGKTGSPALHVEFE